MSSHNSPVLLLEHRPPRWARHRIHRAVWQQSGEWQLIDAAGRTHEAALKPESWLHPWAMCLRFRLAIGGSTAIMVWRWQMSATQWHQWRQRLVLQGATNPTDSGVKAS